MRLFVYGTLADPAALARYGGRPRHREALAASLAGYRRVVLRGTHYPTLRRARGVIVHGFIADVSADELRRLTVYETDCYRRVLVRVRTATGHVAASCFFGPAPTHIAWNANPGKRKR